MTPYCLLLQQHNITEHNDEGNQLRGAYRMCGRPEVMLVFKSFFCFSPDRTSNAGHQSLPSIDNYNHQQLWADGMLIPHRQVALVVICKAFGYISTG